MQQSLGLNTWLQLYSRRWPRWYCNCIPWTLRWRPQQITETLGKYEIGFKIDTVATVTVILESLYTRINAPKLRVPEELLKGPGQSPLNVKREYSDHSKTGREEYISRGLCCRWLMHCSTRLPSNHNTRSSNKDRTSQDELRTWD